MLQDAVQAAKQSGRLRDTYLRAGEAIMELGGHLEDLLADCGDWTRDRGRRTVVADTLAAALAKLAGRELNVSPWSFRRLIEFDSHEAIMYLFDDLEGGSGNSRRLAELLPRWTDLWARLSRELTCPSASADEAVRRVFHSGRSADTLSLLAAGEDWPADWLPAETDAPRVRLRLRRLLQSPELAAFNLYAIEQTRRFADRFGSPPSHLQLVDHVRRTPALDPRAEELRLLFLQGEQEGASELGSRLRAVAPLCEGVCPACLDADRFDRRRFIDREYLASVLAAGMPS